MRLVSKFNPQKRLVVVGLLVVQVTVIVVLVVDMPMETKVGATVSIVQE